MASNTDGNTNNGMYIYNNTLLNDPFYLIVVPFHLHKGVISRTFSMNSGSSWDYDSMKQQMEKTNGELTTLRRSYEHAMKVYY